MEKNLPKYAYDKLLRIATCTLTDGRNKFVGKALCHEDDTDMESEKTGYEIAHMRAKIEYFKHIKNNEIKPALSAVKQVYYTMKHSKKFNPKSYENKMLQRKIRSLEFDLDVVNNMITTEKEKLHSYIAEKEKFYQKIRSYRK